MKPIFYLFLLFSFAAFTVNAQDISQIDQEEIIYARKHGMALTMVVLKPNNPIGKGIVSVISGNWFSNHSSLRRNIDRCTPFLNSGYTVFLVMHGSNPRFDVSEAATDIKWAVQHIRFNAEKYGINPNFIGITGGSSGGHLSLLVNTSNDIKDVEAKNPERRVSSKVQAVAVFYPPTDFLNWGGPNRYMNYLEHEQILAQYRILGALKFQTFDPKSLTYKPLKDSIAVRNKSISVSPAQLVSLDDAPTFIIHGDKDFTVPLQQSKILQKSYDSIGVPLTLIVKPGKAHGWTNMNEDRKEFVKWFDKYLKAN